MSARTLVPLLALVTGCTTLGPMPSSTGISAVPAGRPGAEIQAGIMPAFYLSDAARDSDSLSQATQQLSAVFEPGRMFGTKGLILGARTWGQDGDSPFEPMVGIRRRLDDTFSFAGIVYGTHARGAHDGASYAANRFGGELVFDAALLPFASWLALHGQVTASATYLDAHGTYCVGSAGQGIDCDDTTRRVDGTVEGVYAAATAGLAVDIARRPYGVIHGVRISMLGAVGARPQLRDGIQQPGDHYKSFGLTLTIGFGDDH